MLLDLVNFKYLLLTRPPRWIPRLACHIFYIARHPVASVISRTERHSSEAMRRKAVRREPIQSTCTFFVGGVSRGLAIISHGSALISRFVALAQTVDCAGHRSPLEI